MLFPGIEVGIEDDIEDTHTQRERDDSADVIETSLAHGLGLVTGSAKTSVLT